MSERLSDQDVEELAGLPGEATEDEVCALALEVQKRRAAEVEEAEALHARREAAAGRPVAKVNLLPVVGFFINPEPEGGVPAPTEGLEVFFDAEGRCGLHPRAFPDSHFVLGAAAARELALLILAQHGVDLTQPERERALITTLDNALASEAIRANAGFGHPAYSAALAQGRPWVLKAIPLLADAWARGLPICAALYDFLVETGNLPERP